MATFEQVIQGFTTLVDQRITTKNTVESVDPVDVGGSIDELAQLLIPYINSINNFNVFGGAPDPLNSQGVEFDMYFQFLVNDLVIWKKYSGIWIKKTQGGLGYSIVDGNINLQASVSLMVATVSSGSWGIDNTIYNKATQTQYTIDNADANFDRIDAIFAGDSDNDVILQTGVASSTPTEPVTPVDSVVVAFIYVPSLASGNLPYITDNNLTPPNPQLADPYIFTQASLTQPDGTSGNTILPFTVTNGQVPLGLKIVNTANGSVRVVNGYEALNGSTAGFYNEFFLNPDGTPAAQTMTVIVYGLSTTPPTPTPVLPTITFQPQNATIIQFDTMTLMVAANNAVSYQWYKNGVLISGATSSTYTKVFFQSGDAGNYNVVVTNADGSTPSNNAIITYDEGDAVINQTNQKSTGGGATGRNVTFIVNGNSYVLAPSTPKFFASNSIVSLNIKQSGSDSLTYVNGAITQPILGGNVDNIISTFDFTEYMLVFNDN